METFLRLHRHRDRWRTGDAAAALALHHRPQPGAQSAARPAAVGLAAARAARDQPAPPPPDATRSGAAWRRRSPRCRRRNARRARCGSWRAAAGGDRARDRRAGGHGEVASVPRPAAAARAARRPRARGVTSWRTLGLIRRGTPDPPHDLWPRLRARLRGAGRRRSPAHAVARLARGGGAGRRGRDAVVVPDPLRFLAASGIL